MRGVEPAARAGCLQPRAARALRSSIQRLAVSASMAGSGPISSLSSPSKSSRVGRESSRTGRHLPTTLLAGAAAMLAAMETTAPRLLRLYRFGGEGGESTDGCADNGCGAGAEVAGDDGDAAHTTGSSSEDRNTRSAAIDETARPSPTATPGRTCTGSPHGHGSDRATTSPLAGVWTVAGAWHARLQSITA